MRSKGSYVALVVALIVSLSGMVLAAGKGNGARHIAVGTIASMDANQVVVNEKVKGKEQPMTYKLDSTTQKTGKLATGTLVTIQYRTENNQRIATAVRERVDGSAAAKPAKKHKAS
jgi:hypothetical protein